MENLFSARCCLMDEIEIVQITSGKTALTPIKRQFDPPETVHAHISNLYWKASRGDMGCSLGFRKRCWTWTTVVCPPRCYHLSSHFFDGGDLWTMTWNYFAEFMGVGLINCSHHPFPLIIYCQLLCYVFAAAAATAGNLLVAIILWALWSKFMEISNVHLTVSLSDIT